MKLSVIIPVYNEIHTIGEILSRVLKVDLPKEVMIIGNFSEDGRDEGIPAWMGGGKKKESRDAVNFILMDVKTGYKVFKREKCWNLYI